MFQMSKCSLEIFAGDRSSPAIGLLGGSYQDFLPDKPSEGHQHDIDIYNVSVSDRWSKCNVVLV